MKTENSTAMETNIPTEPGVYHDLLFDDYKQIDAVNNSSLGPLKRSLRHYKMQEFSSETDAMRFGTLCHTALLEPGNMQRYIVMPDLTPGITTANGKPAANPKATSAYKQRVAEFHELHSDRTVISQVEMDHLWGVTAAVEENDLASEYLAPVGADRELTIIWICPDTGIKCKARIDHWRQSAKRITDLKTTQDGRNWATKSIDRYDYDRQAAFYQWGMQVLGMDVQEVCFVVVESAAPYGVMAAPMHPETIAGGMNEVRDCIQQLAKARAANEWPGYRNPKYFVRPEYARRSQPLELIIDGEVVTV